MGERRGNINLKNTMFAPAEAPERAMIIDSFACHTGWERASDEECDVIKGDETHVLEKRLGTNPYSTVTKEHQGV